MRMISLCLVFVLSLVTVNSSYAESRMFSTLEVSEGIALSHEREKVITFMEGQEVQEKLISMGIDPLEAIHRVASLSAKELKQLSIEIDNAHAGGDSGLGTLVGAAILIFVILLITDLLGLTSVFSFTKSAK